MNQSRVQLSRRRSEMSAVLEHLFPLVRVFRFASEPCLDISVQVISQAFDRSGTLTSIVCIEAARNSQWFSKRDESRFDFRQRVPDSVVLDVSEMPRKRNPGLRQIVISIDQFIEVVFGLDAVRKMLADPVKV